MLLQKNPGVVHWTGRGPGRLVTGIEPALVLISSWNAETAPKMEQRSPRVRERLRIMVGVVSVFDGMTEREKKFVLVAEDEGSFYTLTERAKLMRIQTRSDGYP